MIDKTTPISDVYYTDENGVRSAIPLASGGMENPMTTAGDLIVGGENGAPTRLPIGAEGQVLKVGANGLEYGDAGGGNTQMYRHYIRYGSSAADCIIFDIITSDSQPYTNSSQVNSAIVSSGLRDCYIPASGVRTLSSEFIIVDSIYCSGSGISSFNGIKLVNEVFTRVNEWNLGTFYRDAVVQIGGGSASASVEAKYMHNVMANATTQSGTWRYQFELENTQSEPYTQIGQVGHYLYQLGNGVRIPASGMCTLGSDKYIITAVTAASTDNMVKFEMYNILTGEFKDDMTTGAVEVTDVVS